MKDTEALIRQYGLGEDPEYVIVAFRDQNGRQKRRFILKRRFVRVMYTGGYFIDYPLAEVIRATVAYPELPLSEALFRLANASETENPS